MMTINSCPICDGTIFAPITQCVDHTVSHEPFTIVRCTNCNFALTSPRPFDDKLGAYYLSDNYISHSNKPTTILDNIYLLARKFTLLWKINLLKKYYPSKDEVHLLDYGCGTGEFLKSCCQAGYIIEGVEPSESARTKSSEINQIEIKKSIEEVKFETFQIITLWHVLEHIPDFEAILKSLVSKLSDDGILLIAVPNHKSYDAEFYQENWAGYDVPRHLWHFSSNTMKLLIAKNNLQLVEICGMKLDSFYVSLLSEKYSSSNQSTLLGYYKAIMNGIKSNWKARKTSEYSSLIYIVKK